MTTEAEHHEAQRPGQKDGQRTALGADAASSVLKVIAAAAALAVWVVLAQATYNGNIAATIIVAGVSVAAIYGILSSL